MDDDDDFDISEPIEGANTNNFQDLDDLEDDLFGSALKKKLTSKFTSSSQSAASPKHKPVISDEFDEDDPLAGLLSDEDEDKPKTPLTKKRSVPSTPDKRGNAAGDTQKDFQSKKADTILDKKDAGIKKQETVQPKKKGIFDDDLDVLENLGLSGSTQKKNVAEKKPQPSTKESSFMKDLLGNKSEEKQEKPKTTEFKLDEKYKMKTQEKSDYLFGTYSPSSSVGERGTPRRRNAGLDDKPQTANAAIGRSNSKNDDWLSSAKDEVPAMSRRKSGSSDWLLKDNGATSSPGAGRRRQTDWLNKDNKESSNAISDKSDWLNFDGKSPVQAERKSITDIFSADPNKEKATVSENSNHVNVKQPEKKEVKFQPADPITNEKSSQPASVVSSPVKEQKITSEPQANTQSQVALQLQNEMIEQIGSLQSMVTKLQMEKEHLTNSLENTQKRHEEELKMAETLKKEQQNIMEEQFIQKEWRMKEDYEEKLKKLERLVEELKIEKNEFTKTQKEKYEDAELSHRKEVQRLKELHDRAVAAMKEEHEEALARLKELKDQEVEAISSTQSYSKTIQNLAEQLEVRTLELRELQHTVEGRHQDALKERQILLDTKEKDLRLREQRLLRIREEEEEERVRLQQLVMRLESRLQIQTKETEENRWEHQKEKVKLEVQQKSLVEERRQLEEQLDLERSQLKRAKDSLLQEQQRLYTEIAQQRQQLTAERSQFESQMRKWQQQESERLSAKLKDEINLNAERQFLQEEKKQLEMKRHQLEQELKNLQLDRLNVERDLQKNLIEQETTNKLTLELQKKSKEVEEMYKLAIRTREEGKLAQKQAQEIELAANNQIGGLTAQLETIKMKEQQLLEQRLALEEEKKLIQSKKSFMLCANCRVAIGNAFPAIYTTTYFPNKRTSTPNVTERSINDPNMLMWKINAQKDDEFLEIEGSFLKSLTDQTGQNV
ncbi:fas-binding factor 1 homolog [Centruroides sculpturatus]|uniref:fas-binding factor 1 homolog n=1 Tax=Centruroides sculpturatus TaxID=218467 RepID=UPI000C6EB038|nr:fas-binding factor 1 homolog [Centruroides sculpturatus]XP_023230956.1 fas-binding factor 1 homolog [Centruroides sculpturatus]